MPHPTRTVASIATAFFAIPAFAAPIDPATSPAAPSDGELKIVITAVNGTVQARVQDGGAWAKVEPGQEYPEGVEFRTGPRSAVKFDIPPDSSITLDRLGTVKVLRALIENGTIKTDLGMKYGRTRYDIEAAGREHQATIRSASSVLSIRGTDVILDDTPGFPPRATSVTGRARFTDQKGQTSAFGTTGASPTAQPVNIESGQNSAAETALQLTVPNSPLNAGRTPAEDQVVENIPQAGGLPPPAGSGAGQSFLSALGGGGALPTTPNTPPQPPPTNITFLPGQLQFVLDWQGNVDLNLGVISPAGEGITTNPGVVSTVPPQIIGAVGTSVPSGGVASADDKGTSGGGRETITWPSRFPQGAYEFGVNYNSGSGSATFKVDTIVNGVTLDPSASGILTGPTPDDFTSGGTVEIGPAPQSTSQTQAVTSSKKKRRK